MPQRPTLPPAALARTRSAISRPRMKDIADLAGVSVATVSRALSGSPLVVEETRLAVETIVRQTGYTINHAGRGLRLQASRQILVLLPTISNPFFAEIVQGVDAQAQKSGYGILVGSTEGSQPREEALARQMLSGAVEGMVILTGRVPAILAGTDHVGRLVMVSEEGPDDSIDTIGIDNVAASRDATSYLLSLGHRAIGHIAGPKGNILTRQRLAGYHQALHEAAVTPDANLMAHGDFSVASGSRAMASLLDKGRPTAVFCANDDMALGAMAEARARGLTVPADLSVVGFDDLPYAAFFDPALTTVTQPRRRFGELAAEALIKGRQGRRTLDYTLQIRASAVPVSPRDI
eukprot:gene2045-2083_t